MATIRRRGGLFVATAAVCAVLLSTTTAVQFEAKTEVNGVTSLRRGNSASTSNVDAVAKLRGSQRILTSIDRKLQEEEDNVEGNDEEQKDEQEEQKYQEGNGDEDEEVEEEVEEEEEEQQEEEVEEEHDNDVEGDEGYEDADEDESSMYDNVQDTVADAQVKLQDLMERLDEDIVQMWSTSPSEWDGEFWKVFGAVAGAFTILLSCILYLFCICCSGSSEKDEDMMGHRGAGKRARTTHRGRLFDRNRTNDTDTIGTVQSNDYDKPFVLIEDIEKDEDDKSKSLNATSVLSPLSSKSDGGEDTDYSVSRRATPTADDQTEISKDQTKFSKDQTEISKGTYRTSKSRKSLKTNPETPKRGLFDETIDVWSEFLGFKKSKYNMKPAATMSNDEDDDIDLTDDEAQGRKKRSSSRRSRGGDRAPTQMKTGTYIRQDDVEGIDPIVSTSSTNSANNTTAENEKLNVHTPVMSNLMGQNTPRLTKANSPRRTALIKTKNLLKSFGGNNSKNKGRNSKTNITGMDSKEESLLGDQKIDPE